MKRELDLVAAARAKQQLEEQIEVKTSDRQEGRPAQIAPVHQLKSYLC